MGGRNHPFEDGVVSHDGLHGQGRTLAMASTLLASSGQRATLRNVSSSNVASKRAARRVK